MTGSLLLVTGLLAHLAAAPARPAEAPALQDTSRLIGFTAAHSAAERAREATALAVPAPDSARRHMQIISEEPNVAGTPADHKVAEFLLEHLKGYGFDARIEEFDVWLPYPKSVEIDLLDGDSVRLANRPVGYPVDKDSYDRTVDPGWNAYVPSDTVAAQVVYVNYGLPDDYETLKRLGIDPTGKIALAKYGRSFRGVKAKVAEENGAAGLIIYSDPADDGYDRGDLYPDGPWRPPSAIQRGSVLYLPIYPGDPLTPDGPSTPDAKRIKPEDATNVTHIPVAPIAYAEAQKILERLAGPNVPHDWQGGLPLPYHAGPGPARVRLAVAMDYAVRPIWDVVGRIPGTLEPEREVVLGNHHDAWTYGAVDPHSGTTAMLEAARSIGALLKTGWRPRRTIVFAFWDAEEYALLGSTEWVEQHYAELRDRAVAYYNIDAFVAGNVDMEGVPSLTAFVKGVTDDVRDPRQWKPLGTLWHDSAYAAWGRKNEGVAAADRPEFHLEMGPLGSGSDYTAFLDHAGIPSVDVDMSGPYGVYHAIYDDFHWFDTYGDPEWQYTPTMGKVLALLALRSADADVLPYRYSEYGRKIEDYTADLEKSNLDADGKPRYALDLSGLRSTAKEMRETATGLEGRVDAALAANALDAGSAAVLNDALMSVERAFTDDRGLPKRPWFRHMIYAPGFYTGYASLPLPGPAQAIRDRDEARMRSEMGKLEAALDRAKSRLDAATAALPSR